MKTGRGCWFSVVSRPRAVVLLHILHFALHKHQICINQCTLFTWHISMKQSNHSCGGLYRRKLHLLFVGRCTPGSVYAVAEYLGV